MDSSGWDYSSLLLTTSTCTGTSLSNSLVLVENSMVMWSLNRSIYRRSRIKEYDLSTLHDERRGIRWTFRELIVSIQLLQGIGIPLMNRLVETVATPPVSTTGEGGSTIATQGRYDGVYLCPVDDDLPSIRFPIHIVEGMKGLLGGFSQDPTPHISDSAHD